MFSQCLGAGQKRASVWTEASFASLKPLIRHHVKPTEYFFYLAKETLYVVDMIRGATRHSHSFRQMHLTRCPLADSLFWFSEDVTARHMILTKEGRPAVLPNRTPSPFRRYVLPGENCLRFPVANKWFLLLVLGYIEL